MREPNPVPCGQPGKVCVPRGQRLWMNHAEIRVVCDSVTSIDEPPGEVSLLERVGEPLAKPADARELGSSDDHPATWERGDISSLVRFVTEARKMPTCGDPGFVNDSQGNCGEVRFVVEAPKRHFEDIDAFEPTVIVKKEYELPGGGLRASIASTRDTEVVAGFDERVGQRSVRLPTIDHQDKLDVVTDLGSDRGGRLCELTWSVSHRQDHH